MSETRLVAMPDGYSAFAIKLHTAEKIANDIGALEIASLLNDFRNDLGDLWDAGITEGEAYDATNPSLMAERSVCFDSGAVRIRNAFSDSTSKTGEGS